MKRQKLELDVLEMNSFKSIDSSHLSSSNNPEENNEFTPKQTTAFDFDGHPHFMSRKTTLDLYFDSLQSTINPDEHDGSYKFNFNNDYIGEMKLDLGED